MTAAGTGRSLAAVLLLATACSGPAAQGEGPWVEDLPTLVLEEELRIGSLDDPDVGFTNLSSIHVEPSGEVFVAEAADQEIRLYDPAGGLVRTYGREGEGPGEFLGIGQFGLLGDTLWVSDYRLHRMTFFSRAGELLGTVTGRLVIPLGMSMARGGRPIEFTVHPSELSPDGQILGSMPNARYPNMEDSVVMAPRVVFGPDGSIADTLEMVPEVVGFEALEYSAEGGGTSYFMVEPPPLDSGTYLRTAESGPDSLGIHWSVIGPETGELVVWRAHPSGDEAFRTHLRYRPRPVEPEYVDSVARSRLSSRYSSEDSVEVMRLTRSAMRFPPHHRPVFSPDEGRAGNLWIRWMADGLRANDWIVLAPDGRPRGWVDLPARTGIRWRDGDHLWVSETDDFGVPWLVRYRMVEPPRGG